jgi:hypothetical protein
MPAQLIYQLAGGLAASGAVWLLTRRVLQARDAKQTEAARRSSAPLLPSEADRTADTAKRAQHIFERLVSSTDSSAAIRHDMASTPGSAPAKAMEAQVRPARPTPQEILAEVLANVASAKANKSSATAGATIDPRQTDVAP